MDYKEKYEQGLECIQEILCGAGDSIKTSILRKRLQPFFPELKESEDEKIKRELRNDLLLYVPTPERYIAWLEKQGHMLDPDKVIEWLKHCNITNCDMRTSIIPDSSPTSTPHRVRWFSEDFIDKFKQDFGL